MTYKINHTYVDESAPIAVNTENDLATVSCAANYRLHIDHPGKITRQASAIFYTKFIDQDDLEPGHGAGGPGHPQTQMHPLNLAMELRTPDGQPFTRDDITMGDIRRFRDQRGSTQGDWTFSVRGSAGPFATGDGEFQYIAGPGQILFEVEEVVTSKSAPPVVDEFWAGIQAGTEHYKFDLFSVGTFIANAGGVGQFTLRDPDGVTVATGNHSLFYDVTLQTLGKSRDAAGKARKWTLSVRLPAVGEGEDDIHISAKVLARTRINTSALLDRINYLFGDQFNKLSIYGEKVTFPGESGIHSGPQLAIRLVIKDDVTAETADMFDLFKSRIKSYPQDSPDVDIKDVELKKDVVYTLGCFDADMDFSLPGPLESFEFTAHKSFDDMRVSAIDIRFAPSQQTQPPVPAILLSVSVAGSIKVDVGGLTVATAKVRDGRISLEGGLRVTEEGEVIPEVWIDSSIIDVDLDWELLAATFPLGMVGALVALGGKAYVEGKLERDLNEEIKSKIKEQLQDVIDHVPETIAMILGDDFTYRSLWIEGDDFVFNYDAPLEPDPRPSIDSVYTPIMGRHADQVGPIAWHITPPLGDTWAVPKLRERIDHIVVVMMENRSYNHILGYRALTNGDGTGDGLNAELMSLPGFPIGKISDAGFPINTKFPKSVGHELADVTEQLSKTMKTPSGRWINSPEGFVENFRKKHNLILNEGTVKPEHVLWYYEAADLPFFDHLVRNYAFCDRYFSSHAGPTLPNRMFWLTGNWQYDRNGEAVLDNNHGDNFSLSRAATLFDLLSRQGVPWRVYESFPSVAMLRMFARYATDNSNIVRLERLKEDVANGTLPPVAFVEPAMHHAPENDDHPISDMYYGQKFLQETYETLRSNQSLWERTLLIITYDEHGGFYDHVLPPWAEARAWAMVPNPHDNAGDDPHHTPMTMTTAYGVRVPTFVVSPWVTAGQCHSMVLDHCSIAKTILARFGPMKSFLSDRVSESRSFEAVMTENSPRTNVPHSTPVPAPPASPAEGERVINTRPITRKDMRDGNADYHEITGMLARWLGRDKPL